MATADCADTMVSWTQLEHDQFTPKSAASQATAALLRLARPLCHSSDHIELPLRCAPPRPWFYLTCATIARSSTAWYRSPIQHGVSCHRYERHCRDAALA